MVLTRKHRLEHLSDTGRDLRLDPAHERGPARLAQLAGHRVLRIGQARLAIRPQPAERVGIAGPGRSHQSVRFHAKLEQGVHRVRPTLPCGVDQRRLGVAPSAIQIDPAVQHTITSQVPAVRSAGQRLIAESCGQA